MANEVTDPALIALLEAAPDESQPRSSGPQTRYVRPQRPVEVTDPALLAELNRQEGLDRTRAGAAQTFAGINPAGKVLAGFGAAAAEPVLGLSQLAAQGAEKVGVPGAGRIRGEIDENIASVRGAREGAGGWGTAGEIGGFVAGGAASLPAKAATLLSKVPGVAGTVARVAAPAAAEQGLYEASRGTLEGDPSRLERGATGAAGGAVGAGVGRAAPATLSRILEPLRASDAAKALTARARGLGENIDLTVGQAVGRGWNALEEGLSGTPVLGRLINRSREGATETWNKAMLNDVVRTAEVVGPSSARVTRSGAEGIEQAQRVVKDAYSKALEGRTLNLGPNSFDGSLDVIQRLPDSDAQVALKILQNTSDDIGSGNVSGDAITRLRSEIDGYASKAYREGNYPLGKALDAVGSDVRTLINHSGGWMDNLGLQKADAAYAKLADINRAAAMQGAVAAGGRFTPAQLINAQRRGEPASMVASQRTPGMKDAVAANEVLGNSLPRPGPGTAEKVATMATLGLAGQAAGSFLEGDLPGPAWLGAPLAYAALGTRGGRRLLVPELGANKLSRAQVAAAERLRREGVKGVAKSVGSRAGALTLTDILNGEE